MLEVRYRGSSWIFHAGSTSDGFVRLNIVVAERLPVCDVLCDNVWVHSVLGGDPVRL